MSSTDPPPEDDAELAPRPRPGFTSQPAGLDMTERAQLAAALVRIIAGLGGLGGTLLWLPITIATPVLAGVSMLMMVTGCASLQKATRHALPRLARIAVATCAAGTLLIIGLTVTLGAGAFGPVRNQPPPPTGPPTITFEPPPGR